MKSMKEMQTEIDDYIGQFKTGYFSPLANLALNWRSRGTFKRNQSCIWWEEEKASEDDNTIKAELGDNLFVLMCIANSLDIDLTESFDETMEKFNTRDKNRFERK